MATTPAAACVKWEASTNPAAKGNPEETMLQDIFCLISRPQLFRDCSAFFWWLSSLVPSLPSLSGEKKGSSYTKKVGRATPEGTFLPRRPTDIFPRWKREPLYSLQLIWFLYLEIVGNLWPRLNKKRGHVVLWKVQHREHRKHENGSNHEEVLATSFGTSGPLPCIYSLPAQTGLSGRSGYRSSKVWISSLEMSKRLTPRTVEQRTFFQHVEWEDYSGQEVFSKKPESSLIAHSLLLMLVAFHLMEHEKNTT